MQLYNHRSPQLLQTSIQHQTPACIQLPCKASTFLWFTSYSHPCPAHILRAFHQRIFPDGTFPQDFSATLHKQTFTQKSTLFDAFIHNLASTLLVHFFTRALSPHIFLRTFHPQTFPHTMSLWRSSPTFHSHPFHSHIHLLTLIWRTLYPLKLFSKKLCTIWRTHEGRYAPLYQPVLVHAESFLMCLTVIALGGKLDGVEPRSGYVDESGKLLASSSFRQLPICNCCLLFANSIQDHHQRLNANSPSPTRSFLSHMPFTNFPSIYFSPIDLW